MGAEYIFETKQQLNDSILRFPWSEYPLPPIHRACRDGDMLSLTYLTVQGDRLGVFRSINEQDKFMLWTPAHWAAYFGKTECVQRLVECGMNIDVLEGRFNQSPAHLAAFAGHAKLLHWLLEHGAHAEKTDSLGETSVHKAARGGSTECLRLLQILGTSLNAFNMYRQSPCDVASSLGFEQCALFLKSHNYATVSSQRKCKRILDDEDHEENAKKPRKAMVDYSEHIDLFHSNGVNHSLFHSNGIGHYSNGFVTNRLNGGSILNGAHSETDVCELAENSDMEIHSDEIPHTCTREIRCTVNVVNYPPRCMSLSGHLQ